MDDDEVAMEGSGNSEDELERANGAAGTREQGYDAPEYSDPEDEHSVESEDDFVEDYEPRQRLEDERKQKLEEELKERLEEIDQKLRDLPFVAGLENDANQAEFLHQYGDYISLKPPKDHDNVLHMMAFRRHPSNWLIKHILQNHKERMDDEDNAFRRPLYLAIHSHKEDFIKAVLDSDYKDEDLQRVLGGVRKSDAGNCIHLAIEKSIDPALTVRLINKASQQTLKDRDGEGCTPLHRAVAYSRCTESQLDVVKALLRRGDSALGVYTKPPNNYSVYRYHWAKRPEDGTVKTASKKGGSMPAPAVPSRQRGAPVRIGENRQPPTGKPDKGDKSHKGDARKLEDEREKKASEVEKKVLNKEKTDERDQKKSSAAEAAPGSPVLHLEPGDLPRRPSLFTRGTGFPGRGLEPLIEPPGYQANETRKAMAARTQHDSQAPRTSPQQGARGRLVVAVTANAGAGGMPGGAEPRKPANRAVPLRSRVTKASADKIAKEVKLQYLRSTFDGRDEDTDDPRDHKTAVKFLHGQNEKGIHICFNLLEGRTYIHPSILKTGYFKRIVFDDTLQYVAVRRLVFSKQVSVDPGVGRTDMTTLFQWLRSKGVAKIIKVIVHDDEEPSHTDQSIQDSLKGFDVEILDWSKPDLCPETIYEACPNVRKLYLRWSGLNGILRAWGEAEGLAKLPYLTDIYLHQTKYLEPEHWTRLQLDRFEQRLKSSRAQAEKELKTSLPDIQVERPKAMIKGPMSPGEKGAKENKEEAYKTHLWLDMMDKFATGVQSLKFDKYLENPTLPPELKKDVKICLIDDGVDSSHKSITECMAQDGRSFAHYRQHEFRGMSRPYYESTTNHGTLMANMICRVFPNAKITSYRLNTQVGDEDKVHFTAQSAAEALVFAADKEHGFDVISMSWTILRLERDAEGSNAVEIDTLDAALRLAVDNNILVFCAAPDLGAMSPEQLGSYSPIGCSLTSKFFKIGAARVDGSPSGQTGGKKIVDYILPGKDVKEKKGEEVNLADDSPKSGSSIATALAAGVAGLMIHCVRLAAIYSHHRGLREPYGLSAKAVETMRSYATMRRTFDNMTVKKDEDQYIHVWKNFQQKGLSLLHVNELLDSANAEDREKLEDERWEVIFKLARDLISSESDSESFTKSSAPAGEVGEADHRLSVVG